MKKIVYLLLIALLFTSCKKRKKQDKETITHEVTIKRKWQSVWGKVKGYDADGNLVDTKYEEYNPEDERTFYVEFDDNNNAFYTDFNDTNETTGLYIYQNDYLTILNDNEKMKVFVSQLTSNNMTWQLESEKVWLDNSTSQDSIPKPIVKTIVYINFIKVK